MSERSPSFTAQHRSVRIERVSSGRDGHDDRTQKAAPIAVLDELIEGLRRAAQANATVARYAGADAARFEEVGA
jgi:hypothetical protein